MSRVSRTGIVMGIVRERTAYGKLQTAALCCNVNYETKTRETSERRREEAGPGRRTGKRASRNRDVRLDVTVQLYRLKLQYCTDQSNETENEKRIHDDNEHPPRKNDPTHATQGARHNATKKSEYHDPPRPNPPPRDAHGRATRPFRPLLRSARPTGALPHPAARRRNAAVCPCACMSRCTGFRAASLAYAKPMRTRANSASISSSSANSTLSAASSSPRPYRSRSARP